MDLSLNVQTILVGLLVTLVIYKLRQKWKYKQPPGPFALPLIGNLDSESVYIYTNYRNRGEHANQYTNTFGWTNISCYKLF